MSILWNNSRLPDPILSSLRCIRFTTKRSKPRRGLPVVLGLRSLTSPMIEYVIRALFS